MQLSTLTVSNTQTATSQITFRQLGGQWCATWEDFDLGVTYELPAATRSEALKKALRQQRETEILKQIERCMDFLVGIGLLPESIDIWLTDALFSR